jgi:hypothetical protein
VGSGRYLVVGWRSAERTFCVSGWGYRGSRTAGVEDSIGGGEGIRVGAIVWARGAYLRLTQGFILWLLFGAKETSRSLLFFTETFSYATLCPNW